MTVSNNAQRVEPTLLCVAVCPSNDLQVRHLNTLGCLSFMTTQKAAFTPELDITRQHVRVLSTFVQGIQAASIYFLGKMSKSPDPLLQFLRTVASLTFAWDLPPRSPLAPSRWLCGRLLERPVLSLLCSLPNRFKNQAKEPLLHTLSM